MTRPVPSNCPNANHHRHTMTTNYRALCAELLQAWDDLPWEYDFKGDPVGPLAELDDTPFERARAALAQPEPEGVRLEPRGCPTPGACSCPTSPIVPPDLIRALELAEAGLSDIGDAERDLGDDLAWAETRAAQDLPRIRQSLNLWRGRAALAQPEPEGPTDEELEEAPFLYAPEWYNNEMAAAWEAGRNSGWRDALARWGRPAITPIPVSERLPGPEDCDAEGMCWWAWAVGQAWSFCSPPPYRATHWLPAHALPLPAASGEGE